jgi:hypothetical protein
MTTMPLRMSTLSTAHDLPVNAQVASPPAVRRIALSACIMGALEPCFAPKLSTLCIVYRRGRGCKAIFPSPACSDTLIGTLGRGRRSPSRAISHNSLPCQTLRHVPRGSPTGRPIGSGCSSVPDLRESGYHTLLPAEDRCVADVHPPGDGRGPRALGVASTSVVRAFPGTPDATSLGEVLIPPGPSGGIMHHIAVCGSSDPFWSWYAIPEARHGRSR